MSWSYHYFWWLHHGGSNRGGHFKGWLHAGRAWLFAVGWAAYWRCREMLSCNRLRARWRVRAFRRPLAQLAVYLVSNLLHGCSRPVPAVHLVRVAAKFHPPRIDDNAQPEDGSGGDKHWQLALINLGAIDLIGHPLTPNAQSLPNRTSPIPARSCCSSPGKRPTCPFRPEPCFDSSSRTSGAIQ